MIASKADPRATFSALHDSGCFVMPNPWDAGSARFLQSLGFPALASTSSGFAFTKALSDNSTTLEQVLQHLAEIVANVDVPVNADFQAGYAATAEGVAENVRRCVDTGVSGLSIEDSTAQPENPLFSLDEALERLSAARKAIDLTGAGVVLTGRAECFLVGHPDALQESIRRLQAYAEAGADVLYAPGLRTREQISAVVAAVSPKPVNVLVGHNSELTVAELASLGVRRISVGSALARTAWTGLASAARKLKAGSFDGLSNLMPFSELNGMFG